MLETRENENYNPYDLGYFEGVRNVVMKRMQLNEEDFNNWLNDELKDALRIRDEKHE